MIKQKTLHPTIQASAVQLQAQAAAAQTATEIAQAARIANLELQVGALAQRGCNTQMLQGLTVEPWRVAKTTVYTQ